jgi:hypothetical protein
MASDRQIEPSLVSLVDSFDGKANERRGPAWSMCVKKRCCHRRGESVRASSKTGGDCTGKEGPLSDGNHHHGFMAHGMEFLADLEARGGIFTFGAVLWRGSWELAAAAMDPGAGT